jgi:hypothetical protein
VRLTIETEGKGKDRRTRLVGDPAAFFWLLNAAGAAQSGMTGNQAALADGGGILELVPEQPVEAVPRAGQTPLRQQADLSG